MQSFKKFLKENSGGVNSPEFRHWFKNSKVVDSQGNPLVVYHGTPNSSYQKFKPLTHFTPNKTYAQGYESTYASGSGRVKVVDNPKTFGVYLSIQNPFDTRIPAHREIFERELYQKYCGSPLSDKTGLPDWTDLENIHDWIEEEEREFDGILIDEGGSSADSHYGFSYVILHPNQAKLTTNTTFSDSDNFDE